ncbi:MAG: hypothetical protein BGO43_00115 [Gammaproteobacteria bacterium 39-13]|nr:hypothetical protein [Gammaproteobacteria bacterium]OJV96670.1 MAG: hypothetical protein BGO43_00115 [Gammaproteobacteria bacterium 39-13]
MKGMSLRLWGMVNIANFGKLLIDWLQEKKGQVKEKSPFVQSLEHELQKVVSFLDNLKTELAQKQPLLKTLLLSEIECPIYKNGSAEVGKLKTELQKQFIQSFEMIEKFNLQCQRHNELFEKFVQTYIKNGLPLTGIKLYDPVKKTAYQEVNEQYNLLLENAQVLEADCKQTHTSIQNTLSYLSKK